MRDIDKLKEKIELSLDNRQVVSLVIGSLVVLGVVFVLGVMVGKQLAVPAGTPPPQDVLAALDKAAAPKPPEPKLDFQETLPGSVPGSVPPKPEPRAEAKPEPKPEPKPEKKPEPKPEPEVVARPEPKPEKKPEPVAKAEPKPEPKPEPKVEPKPAEKPSPAMDKKLADAFATAQTNKAKEPAPAAPAPRDGFTVQVAASQQKAEADQMMTKLRSSGKSPYLVDAEIPGKGRWYRVRVGSFHSRDEAERYAKDLKRETGINGAFVTSAK